MPLFYTQCKVKTYFLHLSSSYSGLKRKKLDRSKAYSFFHSDGEKAFKDRA